MSDTLRPWYCDPGHCPTSDCAEFRAIDPAGCEIALGEIIERLRDAFEHARSDDGQDAWTELHDTVEAAACALGGASALGERSERWCKALARIADMQKEYPDSGDWGGDTERAETWGMAVGRYDASRIAREALGRHHG